MVSERGKDNPTFCDRGMISAYHMSAPTLCQQRSPQLNWCDMQAELVCTSGLRMIDRRLLIWWRYCKLSALPSGPFDVSTFALLVWDYFTTMPARCVSTKPPHL